MFLQNLIQFSPGNSGFDSYIRRIYPVLPDIKIFFKNGSPFITENNESLPTNLFLKNPIKLIHRYCFLQYFVNIEKELIKNKYKLKNIHCIYSPITEYLFQLKNIPQVITCHDLTPLYYPTTKRQKIRYQYLIPRHLEKAKNVIAISKFTADQLIDNGLSSKKINIIYNGIELAKNQIKKPMTNNIIVMARHDLNKNVIYVLKGFSLLLKKFPTWEGKLYIVGKEGKQSKFVKKIVKELNTKNIVLIEKLSSKYLEDLMSRCFLLISPSLMEGFNYPVVEAMAMGLPTLISDIPIHNELYKEGSLFFKMNDDGNSMADIILKIYQEKCLWKDLSNKGLILSKKFSVQKQRKNLMELLNNV